MPCNIIFAQHLLITVNGQCVNHVLQKLRQLSRNYGYKTVTAEAHRNEAVRDAFISGITSIPIQ